MANIFAGPETLKPTPHVSIGRYLYDKLKLHGDKIALIDALTGCKVTYAELLEKSVKLASVLRDRGIGVGHCIGLSCENNMDFYLGVLTTFFVGATLAPINPMYIARELEHCLLISRPVLIFASPFSVARVAPVVQKMVDDVKLPLRSITVMLGSGPTLVPGVETTGEMMAHAKFLDGLPIEPMSPEDSTSFVMCSSGTTGMPKGVELTNLNALSCLMYMQDPRFTTFCSDDIFMGLLPCFHMYGLTIGLVALTIGSPFVVLPKFQEELFLRSIQEHKITIMFLVPPLLVFLGKHPLVTKYNISSVREIWSGAAPLSREVQEAVIKRLGQNNIRQGYGLTEATLAVAMNPSNCNKYGSSGKLVPGVKCKVIDPSSGKILERGKEGELCFHGELIMKGYKGNPMATDATVDSSGWLHSGDIGYFDKDGYLFVVDRLKELIKYKGFQVAPAELEALLLSNPAVKDAAVIGVPDEVAGELPMAFVVKQPGANITEREIISHIAGLVSNSKQLHGGVKFVSAIPKTASGKILRRELRSQMKGKSKL